MGDLIPPLHGSVLFGERNDVFCIAVAKLSGFLLYLFEELNSGSFMVDISHSVQKTTFDVPVQRNGLSRHSPCKDALMRWGF